MYDEFTKISAEEISENIVKLIGKDWMLITAGSIDSYNTMTASWGQMGVLWNLPVAICYIRPQRHTFLFAEKEEYYTLTFFEKKYRPALNFCGTKSGRDFDKAKETGLTPISTEFNNVSFQEAKLILECKKLYVDDIKEGSFISDKLVSKNYPAKDFHRFYIGEIENVWIKNQS